MRLCAINFRSTPSKPRTIIGRLGLSLFSLFFLGIGLLFVVFITRGTWQAIETRFWQPTDCLILSSSVSTGPETKRDANPYCFLISYRYEIHGTGYVSATYRRQYNGDDSYEDANARAMRYPTGITVIGYVNPRNPSDSVIEHNSPWIGMVILLPLVFVAIGSIGIWSAWADSKPATTGETPAKPISATATRGTGQKFLAGLFSVFFIVGALLTWFLFLRPLLKIVDAQSWDGTPCQIISSRVQTHEGDDGNTFTVDILYAYNFNGQQYKSSRYHFFIGSSSGYSSKAAVVNKHPPGSQSVCYVNPRAPAEAVLNRSIVTEFWFVLIPLAFLLVGAGGLVHFLRGGFKPAAVVPVASGDPPDWTLEPTGPITLRPKHTPLLRLVGALFICLFWNGIVSVFVWQVIKGFQRGRPDWFLTLFLLLFVLVGLTLAVHVIHQFLALFNPHVTFTIHNTALRLGDTLQLAWQLTGRVTALSRFSIHLEGREEATFQQGTRTLTDKQIFITIPLHDTTQPLDMIAGHAHAVIPAAAMHSFNAPHNKIIWSLQVTGLIRWWPDLKEEFPITVLPRLSRP